MSPKRRPAVLVTTFLLVLAFSAIATSVAAGATWGIQGKTLAALGLTEESIAPTEGPLTLEVPGRNIEIECKSIKGTGRILKTITGDATLELSTCAVLTYKTGVPIKSCVVIQPVVAKVVSELTEGEGGKLYLLLKGEPEKPSPQFNTKKKKAACFH